MEQTEVTNLSIPMKDGTTQKVSVTRNDVEDWLTEHNLKRLIDPDDDKLLSNFVHAYAHDYNKTHPCQKGHGGARINAGRKPKGNNGTLRVGIRCSQDVYDILKRQTDMTAFIEKAIRAYDRAYGTRRRDDD